jgi:hypothetical protein
LVGALIRPKSSADSAALGDDGWRHKRKFTARSKVPSGQNRRSKFRRGLPVTERYPRLALQWKSLLSNGLAGAVR